MSRMIIDVIDNGCTLLSLPQYGSSNASCMIACTWTPGVAEAIESHAQLELIIYYLGPSKV